MSSKFKVGDKVFNLRYGVGEVISWKPVAEYTLIVYFAHRNTDLPVREDGRFAAVDKCPSLWTLQEAKDRGYGDQIPKEPFRWEGRIEDIAMDCTWLAELLKCKRGTLTFVESEAEDDKE